MSTKEAARGRSKRKELPSCDNKEGRVKRPGSVIGKRWFTVMGFFPVIFTHAHRRIQLWNKGRRMKRRRKSERITSDSLHFRIVRIRWDALITLITLINISREVWRFLYLVTPLRHPHPPSPPTHPTTHRRWQRQEKEKRGNLPAGKNKAHRQHQPIGKNRLRFCPGPSSTISNAIGASALGYAQRT
jgi:hypothetical protein